MLHLSAIHQDLSLIGVGALQVTAEAYAHSRSLRKQLNLHLIVS
jgi:hypothetical protein